MGNLLADTVKVKTWRGIHPDTEVGLALHHRIDSYTDSHPIVSLSKSRLGPKAYLKGIAIDLVYDHFLINNWDLYTDLEFHSFIENFTSEALQVAHQYPAPARDFIQGMLGSGYLKVFETTQGIEHGFQRMERRLSPRIRTRETMMQHLPQVMDQLPLLESDFQEFFPDLMSHVASYVGEVHWGVDR